MFITTEKYISKNEFELDVEKNANIKKIKILADSDWALVKDLQTNKYGILPTKILQKCDYNYYISNNSYISVNELEIDVNKGDKIILLYKLTDNNWLFVENKTSNETGIVPKSIIF